MKFQVELMLADGITTQQAQDFITVALTALRADSREVAEVIHDFSVVILPDEPAETQTN